MYDVNTLARIRPQQSQQVLGSYDLRMNAVVSRTGGGGSTLSNQTMVHAYNDHKLTSVKHDRRTLHARDTNADGISIQTLDNTPAHTAAGQAEDTNLKSAQRKHVIYVITPTYARTTQKPDLTRTAQSIMLARNVHWIVVEDANNKTCFVRELLAQMPCSATHLVHKTTPLDRKSDTRGLGQRNAGLKWILSNNIQNGVFYFADDDNTYDRRAFDTLITTTSIGFIPVGHFPRLGVSAPMVRDGKITKLVDFWPGGRKWQTDMACFAVNVQFWRSRGSPLFQPSPKRGFSETSFLESMKISLDDLEPKANNATEILVWHTKTKSEKMNPIAVFKRENYRGTNFDILADKI